MVNLPRSTSESTLLIEKARERARREFPHVFEEVREFYSRRRWESYWRSHCHDADAISLGRATAQVDRLRALA